MAGQPGTRQPTTSNSPAPRSTGVDGETWESEGLCRNAHPDALFVAKARQRRAAKICNGCPVLRQCAAHALDNKVEYGVWGGMTEHRRQTLLKQHPYVLSWAELLSRC
ncbi:WhiB family transcriptional regulator [Mycobacterium stomatepiae]|uniref:Transcriptional regulator WhiB n=1 Tax=Mycobacterium stomatepiae TaxID=470076 RepID=A0A7I7QHX2_9MYCO|nr:WhiB family transcriptional regulator [Mycobacterium stomatepiae]BBY25667.1 hypothetical protein MSTO_58720 [Mycobacterium stomatepiae]